MNGRSRTHLARAAAAGLVLIAATAMAAPGLAHEPKQEQRRERERDQKVEKGQKEKRSHRLAKRGPAARAVKTIARKLHLSRDQRRSLQELLLANADDLRDATREIGAARRDLREKAVAGPVDEAAIRGAGARLGTAIGSATVLTAKIADDVRPALTPEQRDRLRTLSARWEDRRGRRLKRVERWDRD